MDQKLHGSPTFYKLLEEMKETHNKKSHDYASNENPYGNYHFAGQLAALFAHSHKDAGFVGRLGEKLYRLANLESSKKTPSNESIEDTERDIAVITALWMADRRDRRNPKILGVDWGVEPGEVIPLDPAIESKCIKCNYEYKLMSDYVKHAVAMHAATFNWTNGMLKFNDSCQLLPPAAIIEAREHLRDEDIPF